MYETAHIARLEYYDSILMQRYTFFYKAYGLIIAIYQHDIIFYQQQTDRAMQVIERVVVAEYNTSVEAEMAKSILACAGIRSTIKNQYATLPGVRVQLLVAESDYRQALTLLRLRD